MHSSGPDQFRKLAGRRPVAVFAALFLTSVQFHLHGQNGTDARQGPVGVYVGTSPADEGIRALLQIPGKAEIIQWKLSLQGAETGGQYELELAYGNTTPNEPGLTRDIQHWQRRGNWKTGSGTKANPEATVYELEGVVSLFQVAPHLLQVLNKDRSLMVGDGGWSFTLNRADMAEPLVDAAVARSEPSVSREVAPVSTGPSVFAVFEGRTPCQGIAREIQMRVHEGCSKAKWLVTLYQNPETKAPTTFKIEGSLQPGRPFQGNWRIERGASNAPAGTVYRLMSAEPAVALLLLKGDDNVLFFLDRKKQPLIGSADFSYTLNRYKPIAAPRRSE